MRHLGVLAAVGCSSPDSPAEGDACSVAGTVCTVAGLAEVGLGADGMPAIGSALYFPQDVAFDEDGALVIVDFNNHRIRRVVEGTVETLIGGRGVPGDGPEGAASDADINHPTGVAFGDGSMWIAGFHNARLLRVDLASGELSFEVGNAQRGYAGDGATVAEALLNQPTSVVFDDDGSLLFSDQGNQLIRRLSPDGGLSRVAGTPGDAGCRGDGGSALDAAFGIASGGYAAPATRLLRVGAELFIVDSGHGRIRVVDLDQGTIRTAFGAEGCGAPPDVELPLVSPSDVAVAEDGTLYVADAGAHCVHGVSPEGGVEVVLGVCGTSGFAGDGGPAAEALLAGVGGIEVAPDGAVVVADTNNHRIRRIAPEVAARMGGRDSPE